MSTTLQHKDRTVLLNALSDAPQFATVRGRQAIVRNAVAGFSFSGEIDKALRFV
jgi:hypothetical protein